MRLRMQLDLVVVIVTWNVRHLIDEALRSLLDDLQTTDLTAHVIVIDSASTDGTAAFVRAQYPSVQVIASAENLGFARANNTALRQIGFWSGRSPDALPRAVFLLNPDTITRPLAVRALFDHLLSNERIGVVGPGLVFGDGAFQHAAFAFPGLRQLWAEFFPTPGRWIEGRFNGRYARSQYAQGKPFPVDFVLGAAMMLRGTVVEQTGGFDEAYFMYCEEIDWSLRIRRAGWEVYTVPAAHVIHLGGQSTGQVRPQSLINLWRSRLRLFDRYYAPPKRIVAMRLVRLGMRLRLKEVERAFQQGRISSAEREALIAAYQTILSL
jgi:GT2 family glycosyltransferase